MAFSWRADDGPPFVVIESSLNPFSFHQKTKKTPKKQQKKKRCQLLKLDPLWQNFLGPRMSALKSAS